MSVLAKKEEYISARWRTQRKYCRLREQQVPRGSVKGPVYPGEDEKFGDAKAHRHAHVHVCVHERRGACWEMIRGWEKEWQRMGTKS